MDIIQLKDSIKQHLSQIVDQGVNLREALFLASEDPMVIEKQVRIDLAHRGSNPQGEAKQVKFKCQVLLEVADESPMAVAKQDEPVYRIEEKGSSKATGNRLTHRSLGKPSPY